ncbi:unnamed protein product [Polarella glacialis]|uniref:Uncharacterized protein n=2 Tax=Polarella glacialis TaxID=89957 RepID=A0A813IK65_POLGL|nr:unnamed protein product [Polarella glacialis]
MQPSDAAVFADMPPSRPSAASSSADPGQAMIAIMESQVEDMRKLLHKFKVCSSHPDVAVDPNDTGLLPGHTDILIFGPSGSGKSSLIRTFFMALNKTQEVPADFADRIIVKDTAMNEGTLKYISAVIKPAKLDHRGNTVSSAIMCHDTRGHIWMDEREQKQLSVIMDGNIRDDSIVQQRNYRYARLLWEFWRKDAELFPPEILARKSSLQTQPHALLFVFDGSMDEIPDGEEETRFYREIIQMSRTKGYLNPQAIVSTLPHSTPNASGASERVDPPRSHEYLAEIAAIVGPLGLEAVMASTRMREVEEWISTAEARGLRSEDIAPARRKLAALATQNRGFHWQQAESSAESDLASSKDSCKARASESELVEQLRLAEQHLAGADRTCCRAAAEELKVSQLKVLVASEAQSQVSGCPRTKNGNHVIRQ